MNAITAPEIWQILPDIKRLRFLSTTNNRGYEQKQLELVISLFAQRVVMNECKEFDQLNADCLMAVIFAINQTTRSVDDELAHKAKMLKLVLQRQLLSEHRKRITVLQSTEYPFTGCHEINYRQWTTHMPSCFYVAQSLQPNT